MSVLCGTWPPRGPGREVPWGARTPVVWSGFCPSDPSHEEVKVKSCSRLLLN